MIIQHNMLANFTNRQMGINNKSISRNTEKLASGYHINRSADDAAGLSISEKMRGQIRGLMQASRNAQDGISLLNVADGGLHEIQSILQRIRELSVQAANDTYISADRCTIQKEILQLNDEVDHIGKSTEFNTIKVLQGYDAELITRKETKVTYSKHQGLVDVMGKNGQTVDCGKHYPLSEGTYTLKDGTTIISDDPLKDSSGYSQYSYRLDFGVVNSKADWDNLDGAGFTFQCTLGCNQEFTFKFDKEKTGIKDETTNANIMSGGTENNKVFTVGTSKYSKGSDFITDLLDFISKVSGSGGNHVGHDNKVGTTDGTDLIVYGSSRGSEDIGYLVVGKPEVTEEEVPVGVNILNGRVLNIQAGANSNQLIGIFLPHIDREELDMDRVVVTSGSMATQSISYVDEMIERVNTERSRIGAYTNRLEHTYANADNMAENLQASESLIRDANLADEMVQFSSTNIIQQAAQSMLAQSNSSPEGILSLLG